MAGDHPARSGAPTARSDGTSDASMLEGLIARAGGGRGPAPVDKWEPTYCGDIDMRIAGDGTWYYMGTPIGRPALVKLFASVLRKDEDGKTYLVTPVEKIGIEVDDAPFVAVEVHARGAGAAQVLTFRTQLGDVVEAGPDHPLRFAVDPDHHGVVPYLRVRGRLDAKVNRPTTYDLLDHGAEQDIDGERWFGVWSGGAFFKVMRARDMEGVG